MTDPITNMMNWFFVHLSLQSQYQAFGIQVNTINIRIVFVGVTQAVRFALNKFIMIV